MHPGPIPTGNDADAVRDWINDTTIYNKYIARQSMDQTLAMMYLRTVDQKKYNDLWIGLQNQHSRGNPQYPKDLSAAYSMVAAHKSKHQTRQPRGYKPSTHKADATGLLFLQSSGTPGTDGLTHGGITCFKCNKKGHYITACPDSATTGIGLLQIGAIAESNVPDDDVHYGIMFTQEDS
jgi:hypothetical protein